MFRNLVNCQQYKEELSILNLPISDNNNLGNELNSLRYTNNSSQLCLLKAFFIKTLKRKMNTDLKTSKQLQIFK